MDDLWSISEATSWLMVALPLTLLLQPHGLIFRLIICAMCMRSLKSLIICAKRQEIDVLDPLRLISEVTSLPRH